MAEQPKLFHGGLRYLEFMELRLVREALREPEFGTLYVLRLSDEDLERPVVRDGMKWHWRQ